MKRIDFIKTIGLAPFLGVAAIAVAKKVPEKKKIDLDELLLKYDYQCKIVDRKNWTKHFTKEHIIPVPKGEPDEEWEIVPMTHQDLKPFMSNET